MSHYFFFYHTHEEEWDISFASSFFIVQLIIRNIQILIGHVTTQCISMVFLTNVWSNDNPFKFI